MNQGLCCQVVVSQKTRNGLKMNCDVCVSWFCFKMNGTSRDVPSVGVLMRWVLWLK